MRPRPRAVHKSAGRAAPAVSSAAGRWPGGRLAPRPVRRAWVGPGSSPSHAVLAHAARSTTNPLIIPAATCGKARAGVRGRGAARRPRAGKGAAGPGIPSALAASLLRALWGLRRAAQTPAWDRQIHLERPGCSEQGQRARRVSRAKCSRAPPDDLGRARSAHLWVSISPGSSPLRLSSPRSRRRGNFLPSVWSCPGKSSPLASCPSPPGSLSEPRVLPVSLVRPRGQRAASAALRSA